MNTAIIGSGAWGTALALLLLRNGHRVTLLCRTPETAGRISETRRNPRLPDAELPEALRITAAREEAGAELVLFAVPSFAVRETAALLRPYIRPDALLVSAAKGLEEGSCLRMSQILEEELSGRPVAVLSGPSHAEEVALNMPTGVIAASESPETAERVQAAFMNSDFRVYTNTDTTGAEICGALKNVVALGCGIADGLGCGDNAMALLITRAMAEAGTLCLRAGGSAATCAGLAGAGDLIVTCTSRHSRNRRAGVLIGRGTPVPEALKQVGAVVEGYYAAAGMRSLAEKLEVSMPICSCIYRILYENLNPADAIRLLMERDRKCEF